MINIRNLCISAIISIILFGLYVELNPYMTNIWWRIDSNGSKQIVLSNLFRLIFAPLEYMFYWNPFAWDINFFIWWLVVYSLITYLKN